MTETRQNEHPPNTYKCRYYYASNVHLTRLWPGRTPLTQDHQTQLTTVRVNPHPSPRIGPVPEDQRSRSPDQLISHSPGRWTVALQPEPPARLANPLQVTATPHRYTHRYNQRVLLQPPRHGATGATHRYNRDTRSHGRYTPLQPDCYRCYKARHPASPQNPLREPASPQNPYGNLLHPRSTIQTTKVLQRTTLYYTPSPTPLQPLHHRRYTSPRSVLPRNQRPLTTLFIRVGPLTHTFTQRPLEGPRRRARLSIKGSIAS